MNNKRKKRVGRKWRATNKLQGGVCPDCGGELPIDGTLHECYSLSGGEYKPRSRNNSQGQTE